jgi:hypothetical protein
VHKAIEKGLEIIPVRVEEPGRRDGDIARDTESMWPDKLIARYARKEWKNEIAYQKKLSTIRLQRLNVKDEPRNANTLPARGSLIYLCNAYCTVEETKECSSKSS